ncbi:MAG: 4Fe-4S binding protein [Desulfosudis oleivorans]|nr:4Fe-4S binding protein [Desulfosudis oleivorans]
MPQINADGVSEIDEALCHGCGICAAECPAKAIELNWYEDDQLMCKVRRACWRRESAVSPEFRTHHHRLLLPITEGTRRRTWQVPCD